MASPNMNPTEWVRKRLEEDGEDLVREVLRVFTQVLLSADGDAACGAPFGSRSPDRINRRTGYQAKATQAIGQEAAAGVDAGVGAAANGEGRLSEGGVRPGAGTEVPLGPLVGPATDPVGDDAESEILPQRR